MLVDVVGTRRCDQAVTEIFEALGYGFKGLGAESLSLLQLAVAIDALEVLKDLGQVLGTSLSDSPLELAGVELRTFGGILLGSNLRLSLLAFFTFSSNLLLNNNLGLKDLPLVFNEVGVLLFVLKGDNGGNFANLLLDLEQFIHVPETELVGLVL